MPSVWINFSPEMRKLVVGCIDYMKQHLVRNDIFSTIETLKYLV